jgi:hypothetical protein
MKVNPWFKCECGKVHIATFVGWDTVCKCGRKLQPQIPIRSTNAKGDIK